MKKLVSVMVVLGFVLGPAILMAQDAPKAAHKEHHKVQAAGEKKVEVPLQDLLLTGKITKVAKIVNIGKVPEAPAAQ